MSTSRWRVILVIAVILLGVGILRGAVDSRTGSLLTNTLMLGLGTILVAIPIGTVVALLVHRTDAWGRRVTYSCLIGLLFVPLYLQAAGWDAWFGRQGWLWSLQDNHFRRLVAAIWIQGIAAVPWATFVIGTALQHADHAVEELAIVEMRPRRAIAQVTLPLCIPAILLACWWIFAMVAGEMTVTDIYQVRTFAEEIYTNLFLSESIEDTEGSFVAIPQGTWILGVWLIVSLIGIVLLFPSYRQGSGRFLRQLELRSWQPLAVTVFAAVLILCVGIPFLNLCLDAGMETRSRNGFFDQVWSLTKCVTMVATSPWTFRREFGWTAIVSGAAATAATGIAIPLGWSARTRSLRAIPALVVAAAAAVVPGPVISLGLIRLMNREESELLLWLYDRTIFAPALASAIRALPVALVICWWGMRTISTEMIDIARLDGLGWFSGVRHVVWPSRRNYFIAAWLTSLAFSAGDLAASFAVTPPGVSTVSHRVFVLLHAGVDDHVAGICLAMLLCMATVAFAAVRTIGRSPND